MATMMYLYLGFGIIALGLGMVGWLLWSEKKAGKNSPEELKEEKNKAATFKKTIQEKPHEILQRLGLEEKKHVNKPPAGKLNLDFLKNFRLGKRPSVETAVPITLPLSTGANFQQGTTSVKIPTEEPTNAPEAVLPPTLEEHEPKSDLHGKIEKLEQLLKENTEELEKAQKELSHEIKNRKEFNKVKDVMEKEIKDRKDHIRQLEVELTETKTGAESNLKRINQLEEKVKSLEKEIRDREHDVKSAQQDVQLEKKKSAEVARKLAEQEKILKEKDDKLQDLAKRLHEMASGQGTRGGEAQAAPSIPKSETERPPTPPEAAVSPNNKSPQPPETQEVALSQPEKPEVPAQAVPQSTSIPEQPTKEPETGATSGEEKLPLPNLVPAEPVSEEKIPEPAEPEAPPLKLMPDVTKPPVSSQTPPTPDSTKEQQPEKPNP